MDPATARRQRGLAHRDAGLRAHARHPVVAGRTFTEADGEDAPLGGSWTSAWPGGPGATRRGTPVPQLGGGALDDGGRRRRPHPARPPGRRLRPQVYWNYRQRAQDRMALVVKARATPPPSGGFPGRGGALVDPEQPVYDVRTLDDVMDRSLARRGCRRAAGRVCRPGAAPGQRRRVRRDGVRGRPAAREFGIRLALGADRRNIVAMVSRRGTRLTIIGLALGLASAAAASRVLGSLLFAIAPLDAVSFATATTLLAMVALTACYLPARRAARVDPTLALRSGVTWRGARPITRI